MIHDSSQSRQKLRSGRSSDEKLLTEMGKFNEELVQAGVMLAGEGLSELEGLRVKFSGSKRTVIDGPFAETRNSSPAIGSGK
jgi:hypothetical protein